MKAVIRSAEDAVCPLRKSSLRRMGSEVAARGIMLSKIKYLLSKYVLNAGDAAQPGLQPAARAPVAGRLRSVQAGIYSR